MRAGARSWKGQADALPPAVVAAANARLTLPRLLACRTHVQVLPFCSEETLEQLEKNLSSLPSVTKLLQSGATPQDITDRILDGIGTAGAPLAITPKWVARFLGETTSPCCGMGAVACLVARCG
jgi:hypothetical protein